MKMSDEKLEQVIGWSIIFGIVGSLGMCINLYRQVNNLEYKVNQLESSVYSAVQTLSTDVYTIKHSKPTNHKGQFE